MREIEIKCRVSSKKELLKSLEDLKVNLGDPLKQHDVVFGVPGSKDNAKGSNWLRIRTENDDKVYFTLKQSVVGHLDSIEHETIVDDSTELRSIIEMLGFEQYSELTKIRRKTKVDDIEICIDEVQGLGTFIEAEKIMDQDADHDLVIEELWGLFSKIGLNKTDEFHEGYDILERKQRGL